MKFQSNSIKIVLVMFVINLSVCFGTQYEYDSLNRLSSVSYNDGTKIIYRYDASGNCQQKIVAAVSDVDINGDGGVNLNDYAILAQQWLTGPAEPTADIAPLGGDGEVDILDLNQMASYWLHSFLPPELFEEGFETGDFSANPWQQSGNVNWSVISDTVYEEIYAAKSGTITHNQQSHIELTLATTFENVSFFFKVSSEGDYDYLRFYIDGVQQNSWSGNIDWTQITYTITPGEHTFQWSYTKDGSVNSGSDCAWIDAITLN